MLTVTKTWPEFFAQTCVSIAKPVKAYTVKSFDCPRCNGTRIEYTVFPYDDCLACRGEGEIKTRIKVRYAFVNFGNKQLN